MKYITLPVPEELKDVFKHVVLGDDGSISIAWATDRVMTEVTVGHPEVGEEQLLPITLLGRVLFVRARLP